MGQVKDLRIFVSWAHTASTWTATKAAQWKETVNGFAELLNRDSINVQIDLWHSENPQIDWTRWGQDQIIESDYVVIAMNEPWAKRWKGKNKPTEGAGVVVEADTLKGILIENQQDFQRRVRIVMLPGTTPRSIPPDLQRIKRLAIEEITPEQIQPMVNDLFNLPTLGPGAGSSSLSPSYGVRTFSTEESRIFRPFDMLLLRYRDLTANTLGRHQEIILSNLNGYAWWGWWKKYGESHNQDLWLAAAQAIKDHGSIQAALFNSGTSTVQRAKVTEILPPRLNPLGDAQPFYPSEIERDYIPTYYQPSPSNVDVSFSWIRISFIESTPYSLFGNHMYISPDLALHGNLIDSPKALTTQDQSLWHIRERD